jgi:hypothetical protein
MKTTAKFMSRTELCGFLGINNAAFSKALQAGHPSPAKGRGFEVAASCRWFSLRPGNGKAKKKAVQYLDATAPAPVPTADKPTTKIRTGRRGIEPGVTRLRNAEEALHRIWQTAVDAGDSSAQTHFRNWQDALDLLAKAELSLVKFRKDLGELTETSKFKSLMKRNVESSKSILLDIPGRVAPQCEGLPWHQVQKLLETEIRRALEKLAAA